MQEDNAKVAAGADAMDELHEITWKAHFMVRLAELFVHHGLAAKDAIADAHAHSQDCYPRRKECDPVSEAENLHRALQVDLPFESA